MKLEVYGEKQKEEVLRLRLVEDRGFVTLQAVDENGKRLSKGNILDINPDGTISPYAGCCVQGIKTGEDGKIKIVN